MNGFNLRRYFFTSKKLVSLTTISQSGANIIRLGGDATH